MMWFVRYSSQVLKKSRTFLVFVVPGGLFIMQDCHGEAVQLSLLGHISRVPRCQGDQGVVFWTLNFISDFTHNNLDHTNLETSGRCQIRNGMNGFCQAPLNSYFMTIIRWCVCLMLCCPEATKYYTTKYMLIFANDFSPTVTKLES